MDAALQRIISGLSETDVFKVLAAYRLNPASVMLHDTDEETQKPAIKSASLSALRCRAMGLVKTNPGPAKEVLEPILKSLRGKDGQGNDEPGS